MSYFISYPVSAIQGQISVPGDKSISHRALMLAAIANGCTVIHGFLEGEDCLHTLAAFRQMGVHIEGPNNGKVIVHGVGKRGLKAPSNAIDCGNSGTTMRLLSGLLAAQHFSATLTGDESLCKRPMERVRKPLAEMGASISTTDGKPPIEIKAANTLHGVTYNMPVASAQVKSCLLLAGLYAEGETTVIEPQVTRDHTERMLQSFAYPITKEDKRVSIQSDAELAGTTIEVPGDLSSAAFFMVAACVIPHSDITLENVGINPTRAGILTILNKMGANIKLINQRQYGEEPVADIQINYSPLKGIDIPKALVPLAIDEFPILFIAAACAEGQTRIRGAEELRSKESDRLSAMMNGLRQVGIDVQEYEDGAVIQGGILQQGVVNSEGDHRIAMAFAIAGAAAKGPITIQNCDNVATSFPTFIQTAKQIHLSVDLHR